MFLSKEIKYVILSFKSVIQEKENITNRLFLIEENLDKYYISSLRVFH